MMIPRNLEIDISHDKRDTNPSTISNIKKKLVRKREKWRDEVVQ